MKEKRLWESESSFPGHTQSHILLYPLCSPASHQALERVTLQGSSQGTAAWLSCGQPESDLQATLAIFLTYCQVPLLSLLNPCWKNNVYRWDDESLNQQIKGMQRNVREMGSSVMQGNLRGKLPVKAGSEHCCTQGTVGKTAAEWAWTWGTSPEAQEWSEARCLIPRKG